MGKKWVAIICATVLLTGCKVEHWVPTGKTDAETVPALTECKHVSSPEPVPFTEPAYMLPDEQAVARCMKAHGQKLVTEDSQTPQGNARVISEAQLDRLQ